MPIACNACSVLVSYELLVVTYKDPAPLNAIGPNSVNFNPILMFEGSIWGVSGVLNPFPPLKMQISKPKFSYLPKTPFLARKPLKSALI